MSERTIYDHNTDSDTPNVTRQFIFSVIGLAILVAGAILLQPNIQGILVDTNSPEGTTGNALSPIEESERFTSEWYQWYMASGLATTSEVMPAASAVEEAERFTSEWYQWYLASGQATTREVKPAVSAVEEAERFTSEWYHWYMALAADRG